MGVGAFIAGGAAIAGAGASIYGASQASSGSTSDPNEVWARILRTQIRHSPLQLAYERQYQPLYGALQSYMDERQLLGAPEREISLPFYDQKGRLKSTHTVMDPGQRGYLDLYENEIAPASARVSLQNQTMLREGNVRDLEQLAPETLQALRGLNPEQTALVDELTRQSATDLSRGARLNPSEAREVRNNVRGGQAARGMGLGGTDLYEEISALGAAGQQRQQERRRFATDMVGINQSLYGDQLLNWMGSGNSLGVADSILGRSREGQGGPRLFQPDPGMVSSGVYSTPDQRPAAWAGLGGGLLSSAGALGGAYLNRPQTTAGTGMGVNYTGVYNPSPRVAGMA